VLQAQTTALNETTSLAARLADQRKALAAANAGLQAAIDEHERLETRLKLQYSIVRILAEAESMSTAMTEVAFISVGLGSRASAQRLSEIACDGCIDAMKQILANF